MRARGPPLHEIGSDHSWERGARTTLREGRSPVTWVKKGRVRSSQMKDLKMNVKVKIKVEFKSE